MSVSNAATPSGLPTCHIADSSAPACLTPAHIAHVPCSRRSETLTDRPSSRVLAAPGGRQSFNIFGGESEAPPASAVARPTAAVGNQDQAAGQRLAVRTEHTGISDHPSSRVLSAPGGKQSFSIFGHEETAPAAPPSAREQQAAHATAVAVAPVAAPVMAAGQRVVQRTEFHGIQDRNSTLVHAAPGGSSEMASIVGGSTAADRIAAMKAKREAASAAPLAEATNSLF